MPGFVIRTLNCNTYPFAGQNVRGSTSRNVSVERIAFEAQKWFGKGRNEEKAYHDEKIHIDDFLD